MKSIFWTLALLSCGGGLFAQSSIWDIWEAQPIHFDREVKCMYYDSVTQKSYIGGYFRKVNGDSANVVV